MTNNQTTCHVPLGLPSEPDCDISKLLDELTFRLYHALMTELSNDYRLRSSMTKEKLDEYTRICGRRLTTYGE